jgi:putative nucleotidyltransferase with HDIG domain
MRDSNYTTGNGRSGEGMERSRALIAERIRSFPAMPAFVSQVISMLNNPKADALTIAGRIKFDPGMTANILRLANSAEFGAHRSVHSLQEAIVRLGLKQLFQLVTTYGLGRRLSKALPGYELQADELLRHSLWAALAAEELCLALSIHAPDMLFTSGLLHDLGKLILDEFIARDKAAILARARAEGLSFEIAEASILGVSHAEVGATVLDQWNFPAELVAAARWHHRPQEAREHESIASIVHIAEFLAYTEGIGTGIDGLGYHLSQDAIDNLGVRKKDLEWVASHTLDKMRDLEQLLKV